MTKCILDRLHDLTKTFDTMKPKVPSITTPSKRPHNPFAEKNGLPPPQLNLAVVGGGHPCYDFLCNIHDDHLSTLDIKILGVADADENAPGIAYAKSLKIFTTTDYHDFYSIEDVNFILELTGSLEIIEDLNRSKPARISLIDHRIARNLLLPLLMKQAKAYPKDHSLPFREKKALDAQTILDSLPYRVMVVNDDMSILTVNRTFLQDRNLTYKDTLGKHCYEVRYGLDKPCKEYARPCYLEEVRNTLKTTSSIHDFQDEEGRECHEVITVSPIFDENNEVAHLLEASRDVTKRIKLEREVQESHVFLQHVIQSTVDGIPVVNTKGYVIIFNKGMERLTGYSAQGIKHLGSFYNIDVARENMRKMRSTQYGPLGKLNPTSMSITTKEGEEIPVTLSASIIEVDGKEVGSIGVFRDMRQILNMRKNLEEAHLQLVESEKIATVGRLAAGIAHEINNPLSGILIYAELLKENLKDNSEQLGDTQEIIDQTLRCKKIVSELLEFSRQSIGKPSSFHIKELITTCLNLLVNQAIFQNIQVKTEIDPDMPEIVGDMGQLQQVFTNLFINAADAMAGEGTLDIKASYDPNRSCAIIKVSDTGPGIPVHLNDKIFDIFFTTKPVGKGTGLGLSVSQNIINLHGGNITFERPPEGGTTFIIELPLEFTKPVVDEPFFIGLDES